MPRSAPMAISMGYHHVKKSAMALSYITAAHRSGKRSNPLLPASEWLMHEHVKSFTDFFPAHRSRSR